MGLGGQETLSLQRLLERKNKDCLFKDRSYSYGGQQGSPSRSRAKHLFETRRPAMQVNDRVPEVQQAHVTSRT